MMAPQSLTLKLDAQVMLIKNIDETLVNGSMGKIIGFIKKESYREDTAGNWIGREPDDDEPEDLSKPADSKKKQHPDVSTKPMPVVSFRVPGGGRRDVIIEMDTFKVELPNGEVQAQRLQVSYVFEHDKTSTHAMSTGTQLPLILAWAMSIHKSQGQSAYTGSANRSRRLIRSFSITALERVKVDLGRVFEKGQGEHANPSWELVDDLRELTISLTAYVALSRATSLDGLQVLGFNQQKVNEIDFDDFGLISDHGASDVYSRSKRIQR
jgi:ATP-dependent DNA helicase PIF1